MYPDKPLMPFATDDNFVDCRRNFRFFQSCFLQIDEFIIFRWYVKFTVFFLRESDIGCFLAGDIRSNEQVGLLVMHTMWFRQHNFIARQLRHLNRLWSDETVFQETKKIVGAIMQHISYVEWLPKVVGSLGMEELGPYRGYNPRVNPTITNEFATAAMRYFLSAKRQSDPLLFLPRTSFPLHLELS
jgi:hypothetical protein